MIERNNIVCRDEVLPLEDLIPKEIKEELCGRYVCVHTDDLQEALNYISYSDLKFKVLSSYQCALQDEIITRFKQITGEVASEKEIEACMDKLGGMSGIWESVEKAVTKCVSEILDIKSKKE